MYIKILYDDKAKRGLLSGRGFSCLIDGKILFDAGGDPDTLLENMGRLMVSIPDLEAVVISHDHWDHTGGLWEILKRKKGLKVYACMAFSDDFKKCVKELGGKLVFVEKPTEIKDNIYVTGAIEGKYKDKAIYEQALVVKSEKGISLINGCSHAGVVNVIKSIRQKMDIDKLYMVLGGFHLNGADREFISDTIADLESMGVEKVGPTHCTGDKAARMFSGKFHENFVPVKAGHIIQL
jgi:7,8-dihydropterin-6-yl-methyl-4-(beta-D-ribofuranosyl)aminobenzene 5'-phosphate synthase